MKSGIPWNLKRVDDETRRAVVEAAQKSGLTVGEWLNRVLAGEGEAYDEPVDLEPRSRPAPTDDLATAIGQIRSRLRQIEDSVAGAAERRRPPSERRREPKSVQEMIADLAREIENPDERARSSIEGLPARSAASADAASSRVGEAIRDLDQKIAAMGRRIADPQPPADEQNPPRLDDIRYHLNALLARGPKQAREPMPQAVLIDAALRALESRIDDAKAEIGARAGEKAMTAEQIARVEARLAEIGERLTTNENAGQKARREPDLASAIREISAHQRALDDRAETLAMRRDQKALAAALAALRTDIASLNEQVSAITRVGAEEHGAIFDIGRRIEAIAAETPVDRTMLAAIREDLDTLHAAINGNAQTTVGRLEDRNARLAAQIDELASRTVDPARLDALGKEVAELRRALETDDSPRAIQRLEMRVAELGRAIEAALSARHAPTTGEAALQRLETRLEEIAGRIDAVRDAGEPVAAISDAEKRLENRLADIAGRIDVLRDGGDQTAAIADVEYRLESRLADIAGRIESLREGDDQKAALVTAERRIESRLADLAGRLGGLVDTGTHGAAIEAAQRQLEDRLEEVVAHLGGMLATVPRQAALETLHERLQAISERIDRLSSAQREPAAALDSIKAEIAALRAEVAGRPVPEPAPSTEHLEAQIRELASHLETVVTSNTDGTALAELEDRVAHLASDLEQTKPRMAQLADVEESLVRLQGLLADTTRQSIDSARTEARKAVSELSALVSGNEVDSELVRGLMRDLEQLKTAAGAEDGGTRSKIEAVGATLSEVVERLTRLEGEARKLAERPPSYAIDSTSGGTARQPNAWTATVKAALALPVRKRLDEAPPVKPPKAAESQPQSKTATTLPPIPPQKAAADRRADFIAAARRAAQAAADRGAAGEKSPRGPDAPAGPPAEQSAAPGEDRQGAFARISQAIRNRRRPLLLAAAAIVLAVAAMQLYGKLTVAKDQESLISSAEVAGQPPSQFRSATASLPTMPRVAEDALVLPTATPDRALAFAAPESLDSRFDGLSDTLDSTSFSGRDLSEAADGMEPPEDTEMMLASAGPDALPPASVPGLDPRLGSQKLLTAAASGDPAAAFEIATRYADGTRVRRDLAKAAEWYAKAAEAGVAVAQYRLGSLYERGQGVSKDLVAATNWYQRAADQGNVNAMHNLAVLMSEGPDGLPDHDKALQWFLAAGNYGVRDSQYNLGVIYARGLGPAQDLVESYKWFAIAAAEGDTDAGARRDDVAKILAPDDLARARATVSAWHVKPPLAEANGVSAPGDGWDGPGEALAEADRQALVRKIQTLLAEQGYDPGPADGLIGPKTVEAVRAYQRKVGQPETGQIDNTLMAALGDRPI